MFFTIREAQLTKATPINSHLQGASKYYLSQQKKRHDRILCPIVALSLYLSKGENPALFLCRNTPPPHTGNHTVPT